MGKTVRKRLTTFQIAKMLGVSDQSVASWIDSGQLPGERTPGGHRRVKPADLVAFLREHRMEVPPELDDGPGPILVVDDESDVAEYLASVLRREFADRTVLTAHDGYAAGKIVASDCPDLVVLDLYMPGMDGFAVCSEIKQDPRTETTLVIAITAHPSAQAEEAIREAGADEFLPKPIDGSSLAELARNLMQRKP